MRAFTFIIFLLFLFPCFGQTQNFCISLLDEYGSYGCDAGRNRYVYLNYNIEQKIGFGPGGDEEFFKKNNINSWFEVSLMADKDEAVIYPLPSNPIMRRTFDEFSIKPMKMDSIKIYLYHKVSKKRIDSAYFKVYNYPFRIFFSCSYQNSHYRNISDIRTLFVGFNGVCRTEDDTATTGRYTEKYKLDQCSLVLRDTLGNKIFSKRIMNTSDNNFLKLDSNMMKEVARFDNPYYALMVEDIIIKGKIQVFYIGYDIITYPNGMKSIIDRFILSYGNSNVFERMKKRIFNNEYKCFIVDKY